MCLWGERTKTTNERERKTRAHRPVVAALLDVGSGLRQRPAIARRLIGDVAQTHAQVGATRRFAILERNVRRCRAVGRFVTLILLLLSMLLLLLLLLLLLYLVLELCGCVVL
jgi:hypothetical protein